MKRIIHIFVYLTLTMQIFGQSEFAQIGTIWKYYGYYPFLNTSYFIQGESVKDTIIQNLSFKKVTRITEVKKYCYPNCPLEYYTDAKYFRQSNDSLFEYDFEKNKPIFFFNYKLRIGDIFATNYRIDDSF